MSYSASLLEHCQCFPREDVFLVFALGSVRRNTVPRDVFPCTLPRTQEVYWISSNINPVASEYQEIYSYSALIIDSVKINTSLVMMRECDVRAVSHSCDVFSPIVASRWYALLEKDPPKRP